MNSVIYLIRFAVDKGDMEGLLTAIRTVLANSKIHYLDTCRKKAERDYNKDIQYGKYIELYRQTMSEIN